MDYLDGIGLRAMAQREPLVEYQREGYTMFQNMLAAIREDAVRTLFQAQVEYARSRYNFLLNRLLLTQATGDLDIEQLRNINAMLTVDAEAQLANPPSQQ